MKLEETEKSLARARIGQIFLFLKDMDVFLEFVEGATTDDELVLILDCFDCIRVLLLVKIDFDFE